MLRSAVLSLALLLVAAVVGTRAFVVVVVGAPGAAGSSSRQSHVVLASEIGPAPGPAPAPAPPAVGTIRVVGPDGALLKVFEAKPGTNLRKNLQAQKLDVYDLMGKMTNCNGAGQCGTCAVKVESSEWGPRSDYEAQKLSKKYGAAPEYRLACQTLVEGGAATVTLRPKKP